MHGIEQDRAFFVGQKAWHGIGKMYDADSPPKDSREAIVAAKADYTVQLRPLFFPHVEFDNSIFSSQDEDFVTKMSPEQIAEDSQNLIIPDRFAVVRTTDNKPLGIVGSKYTPLQNIEAFEFFDPFIQDKQATFEAGGVLNGGSRIWVLAKINEGANGSVIDNDAVNTYLLLYNSHDGTTNVGVMMTPVRVVCQNTLSMATQGFKSSDIVKIAHTKSMKSSMSLVQKTIDLARKQFIVTLEQYRQMQERKIDMEGVARFAMASIKPTEIDSFDMNKLPRVVKNTIDFYNNHETQTMPGVRGTVWGAYNAVTGFVDHIQGRSAENRLNSTWFGPGKKIRERAHKIALDLVTA